MPIAKEALAHAVARLEERFGTGVVLPSDRAAERDSQRRMPFGVGSIDALLDGGLLAGEPFVLFGEASSGTLTLCQRAASAAQASGGEVAWVDPTRSFEAESAARSGIDLERLLLVRAPGEDAVRSAVTLARSAAFVLVVVDLGPRLVRSLSLHALASVVPQARAAGVSLLILVDRPSHQLALPSLEVRRVDWLRRAGRVVGWRSVASRPHRARVSSFRVLPLALPPLDLVDEGLGVRSERLEAVS